MKVLGLVSSCRECPNRVYYSGGQYVCSKAGDARLPPSPNQIPDWCPLSEYPAPTSSAPNTPADQGDAVREAWAYLTPHPLINGSVVLDGPKLRKAIATLRTERDQLAADLRKAREALSIFAAQTEREWMGEDYIGRDETPHWAVRPTKLALIAIAALTPDPQDVGGTAKGDAL